MSELTRCNYCTLLEIKRRNPGKQVTVRPDEYGWQQVYVDGVRYGTSFLQLTDHCVC